MFMQCSFQMFIFIHMNMSEPFRFTNEGRQGGVLSPCLFAAYLDDLSTELNNINAGCYIGEFLFEPLYVC